MASWMEGNANPVYRMRDTFDLQAKVKEAKVLGPEGSRTDLIQKLALTTLPTEDQLSVLRKAGAERVSAKDNSGFTAIQPTPAPKKEAAPVKVENVYRETRGFAAVA